MSLLSLLDLPAGLQIAHIDQREDHIHVDVVATFPQAICPCCQQPASRIHSRYTRKVTDLCCAGRRVELFLHVRKFFCQTGGCSRKIFCERLSPFIEPWARLTRRLSGVIEAVGLGTCGRLGVRLCHRLGIATSRMSILRRLMKLVTPDSGRVTSLGIDDFSFRRGRTFGTVLVDLEHHKVIDLLPDRQVQTATDWMQKHPEIRYVSRDRGSEYAAAANGRRKLPLSEQILAAF